MLKELSAVADPKDPRLAIVSLSLGREAEARGEDPKNFLKLGEQALSIFETAGDFSLEVGMCHHLIALAHLRLGQQALSLENLNKALLLLQGKEGKESAPIKFAVRFLLGDTLAALGKHEEALQHYVEGLAVQETILEKGHPQLASNYRQVSLSSSERATMQAVARQLGYAGHRFLYRVSHCLARRDLWFTGDPILPWF